MQNQNSLQFRQLGSADLSDMRALNRLFAKAFADEKTHLSQPPREEYLKRWLSQNHVLCLGAFLNNQLIGGLVAYVLEKYEQERSEVYIYDLAVAEEHRRRGVATQLIQSLKPLAKSKGAWVIFVQADPEDQAAVRLYESLGKKEAPFHFDIAVD